MGPDMEGLEKFLQEQFPFLPKGHVKERMQHSEGNWIGEIVQDVLKRSFAGAGTSSTSASGKAGKGREDEDGNGAAGRAERRLDLEHEVFETHNSVIVRVNIPVGTHIRNIRVHAGNGQLMLEKDPSRVKQYIRLPAVVDPDEAKAAYKDGVLEIRLPRLDDTEFYRELKIRHVK